MRLRTIAVLLSLILCPVLLLRAQPQASRNVVIITLDGLRWQEFFGGADRDYFKKGKDGEVSAAEKRYWRASADGPHGSR